jgi:ubiquitin carboxyl-terminal hydrolase 4/11/15
MSIYKAPETLVFSLKRFKSKNKYFKSKLDTLVTFPVRNFELSEFVLNTTLPNEYDSETTESNGQNGMDCGDS